jgi:flagellar motor component MotA
LDSRANNNGRDIFKKLTGNDPHAFSDAAIEWAFGILSAVLGICLGMWIMPSLLVFMIICIACAFVGLFLGILVVYQLRKRRAQQ